MQWSIQEVIIPVVKCCCFVFLTPTTLGQNFPQFRLTFDHDFCTKRCIMEHASNTYKLHSVKPDLGYWQSSYRRCRKDEVVLCRARIGHTYFTHSYMLKKDPPPLCEPPLCEHCQCILTVRHILVECNNFARERKDIFGRRDVVESFRFHPTLIVLFLHNHFMHLPFPDTQ